MKRKTSYEFLRDLNGNGIKYVPIDEYNGSKNDIRFRCYKCGEIFSSKPNYILQGQGCPYCSRTRRLSEPMFIEMASKVHDNFFSYDDCGFKNVSSKVNITCPIHGTFSQKASNHLQGQGCQKCKQEGIKHKITQIPTNAQSTKRISTSDFINKAKPIIGEKYDLSLVNYNASNEKVDVICKEHGVFKITPNKLLLGRGCPICARNVKLTTDDFIERVKLINGDKYDYSKTKYANTHEYVTITCKEHGDFMQYPSNHLRGQGCPICNESHLEKDVNNILLESGIKFVRQYKIGNLFIDFYLPSHKVGIECQGIQHFKPIEFFGGAKAYVRQVERDERKYNLCESNGIRLLYYSNIESEYPHTLINNRTDLLEILNEYKNTI